MSRSYTKVSVFCDMREGRLRMSANMINHIKFLSLKKSGGNTDDNDVMLDFYDFPVKDSDRPDDMPEEEWVRANVLSLREAVEACFTYGRDKVLNKMGIQELTERIKRITGKGNAEAFEMAASAMERNNRPSTHVVVIADEHSPSFVKAYAAIAKGIETDYGETCEIVIVEACDKDYDHDVWFGDEITILHGDKKGNSRPM